jgi:hypothetical protein
MQRERGKSPGSIGVNASCLPRSYNLCDLTATVKPMKEQLGNRFLNRGASYQYGLRN